MKIFELLPLKMYTCDLSKIVSVILFLAVQSILVLTKSLIENSLRQTVFTKSIAVIVLLKNFEQLLHCNISIYFFSKKK